MNSRTIETVLVVDDDAFIRRITSLALERGAHWRVLLAGGGEEALLQLNEKPDLILLDVMMPGMDGLETFAAIRRQNQDIPIIFLTAKVLRSEVEKFMSLGATGVIKKPFDPLVLSTQIMEILKTPSAIGMKSS